MTAERIADACEAAALRAEAAAARAAATRDRAATPRPPGAPVNRARHEPRRRADRPPRRWPGYAARLACGILGAVVGAGGLASTVTLALAAPGGYVLFAALPLFACMCVGIVAVHAAITPAVLLDQAPGDPGAAREPRRTVDAAESESVTTR